MIRTFACSYSITLNSLKHNFNRKRDMVIHHGLMGNSKNFRTISKNSAISNFCNSELIDCRNHGSSPHTETHTMEDLADDLHELLQTRIEQNKANESWKRISLMGHSMGAIALMAFSVKYPEMQKYVDRIIIVDIPCIKMDGTASWDRTGKMLQSMLKVDLNQDIMKVFQEIQARAFNKDVANLLKGNIKISNENKHEWIPNIKTIVKDYRHIGQFSLTQNSWRKPVEVIYGDRSHYVDQTQIRLYEKYYPQMQDQNFYKIVDAGHWVHFDKTKEFLATMKGILQKDE